MSASRPPRLIMTLLVRDEADIVAQNVAWHLAQGVDHVVATDNGSTDGTVEALQPFVREGVLTLLHEPSGAYRQDVWMTRMALMARDALGADWVFCNDADEFWRSPSDDLHDVLPERCDEAAVLMCARQNMITSRDALQSGHWSEVLIYRTVCPPPLPRGSQTAAGLNDLVLEVPFFQYALRAKTLLPTRKLREVARGAHAALYDGEAPPRVNCPVEIVHFPIRSREEFERSVVRIGGAVRQDATLRPNTSWKYRRWLAMTEASGSIWPAFREALPDRRSLLRDLGAGRVVRDTTFASALARLTVPEPEAVAVAVPAANKHTGGASQMHREILPLSSADDRAPTPGAEDGGQLILLAGPDDRTNAAIAKMLFALGATPPRAEVKVPGGSDLGPLALAHEAALAQMGRGWDDLRGPPDGWFDRPVAKAYHRIVFEALMEAFADLNFAVLSDSRLCLLLPLWKDIAGGWGLELNVLVPVRNPLEVSLALHAETGVPVAFGLLIWARDILTAERDSRGMRRLFVRSEDLVASWREVAGAIEAAFAPDWPGAQRASAAKIETALAELWKAPSVSDDAMMASPRVPDLVRETLEAMRALADGAEPGTLVPTLDGLHSALDGALDLLGPSLQAFRVSDTRQRRRLAAFEPVARRAASLEAALARASAEHEGERRLREVAEEKLARAEEAMADLRVRVERVNSELQAERAARGEGERTIVRAKKALAASRADAARFKITAKCRAALEARPDRGFWSNLTGSVRRGPSPKRLVAEIEAAPEFDADWYRSRYPDVAGSGIDPATHFLRYGAREARDPGPRFDTVRYYQANPDVLAAGMIALVHYHRYGRAEGRRAFPVDTSPQPK